MKYFQEITNVTKSFLEGNLKMFTVETLESDTFKVSILYKDDYDFNYDYDFEINGKMNKSCFISHHSINTLNSFSLNRDESFEKAIEQVLCKQ